MALILVKGPKENLARMYNAALAGGFKFACHSMNVILPPQVARVSSPCTVCGDIIDIDAFTESHDNAADTPRITFYYDPYDHIPLEDGSLIAMSRTYFDDPYVDKYMTTPFLASVMRFATLHLAGILDVTHIRTFTDRSIQADTMCEACAHPIGIAAFRINDGRLLCKICAQREDIINEMIAPTEVATPDSPVARFMLEQLAIGFSADMLSFPHELQTVYLIGNDYYISRSPIPATMHNAMYPGRKRLRMTKKVISDITGQRYRSAGGSNMTALQSALDAKNAKCAFREFMSDAS